MGSWEFLIQREGDRGWRSSRTGNLHLVEGKYRIIAKSDLLNLPVHTRITHQVLDRNPAQCRSRLAVLAISII